MSKNLFAGHEQEAFELLQRLAVQGGLNFDVSILFGLALDARHLLRHVQYAKDNRLPAAGGIKGLSRSTEGKKGKDNASDD